MTTFQNRKQKILQSLAVPDDTYTDASPKGTVDAGIRELVDEINGLNGFVTTSSCAGRVAIYVDGCAREIQKTVSFTQDSGLKTGSKGGGRWLFVSHDPVTDLIGKDDKELLDKLELVVQDVAEASHAIGERFVHLKFEPMHAKHVLSAAMTSGFRESGISSVNDGQDVIMTAVRTNGLAFDGIIGSMGDDDTIQLAVTPAYIRMLLQVANVRFAVNQSRTQRFSESLRSLVLDTGRDNESDWEPAEVRKARKRAEGLQRQQQLKAEVNNRAEAPKDLGLVAAFGLG